MTVPADKPLLFADLALSRRLERAEARANAEFVEARAKVFPDIGGTWIDVAGTYAMYDGPASPCTQTFGLGLFQPAAPADLEKLEGFFKERGAPVFHEVSPLAEGALPLLNERRYQPIELTSLLFRPLERDVRLNAPRNDRIQVRLVRGEEHEVWERTLARGWGESQEVAEFFRGLGAVNAARPGSRSFLAELDGQPLAAGGLSLFDGVAVLAGASTVPEGRKQGGQLALLEARLRYAAEQGCELAMMGAAPGSASQRNAERHGFRIAYTRIKWRQV
jgi:hypothetical protein